MKENKRIYFSMDVYENPPMLYLHSSLEEAKNHCLKNAEEAYYVATEDGFFDRDLFEFDHAVYGIVMGKAEIEEKKLTEEEKEFHLNPETGEPFETMSLSPEIKEYEKENELNLGFSWFSVKDKMPDLDREVLFTNGDECFVGYLTYNDGYIPTVWVTQFGHEISGVTHWCYLPKMP